MAESTIITGQFVRINQTPASIGERLMARLVDYLFILIYVLGFTVLLSRLHFNTYSNFSRIFILVVIYLPILCYSLLCEVFNRGQSIGKRLMNIRVVKVDGSTPSLGSYLLRWLLFSIDMLLSGGLGILFILLSKNHQRLGDLAAGTMVIKEKNYRKIHVSLDEFDYLSKGYRPVYPSAADLSMEQVHVIDKTLASRGKDRERRIRLLADKVRAHLSIGQTGGSDEQFLQTLLRDYQYFALEEI